MASLPSLDPADFQGEITLDHVISEASANFAPLPSDLSPGLVTALAGRGTERLYSDHADAYRAVRQGRHLVVVTPTASRNTQCYNLPCPHRLPDDPTRRAQDFLPTKALERAQMAEIH